MPVLKCPIPKAEWVHEVCERNGLSASSEKHLAKGRVEEAGPWELAVRKLEDYQHLGDDWDGFGAKAPSHDLLTSAVGLAHMFYERGVDAPHRVAPGVNGSVILEWQFPDGTYAEVEIVRPLYAEVMMIEPGQPAKHWTLPTE
jgi:hypothetical protein